MRAGTLGIIANPMSGKDIRRLVAYGSAYDNNEKINIIRRLLLGLDAADVAVAYYLPDTYEIVPRAAATLELRLALRPLPMPVLGNQGDSTEAAQRLADLDVGCIVTLGGDGTNRAVAKGAAEVPLVPISTGTNNVFPAMVEGTLAGLAAGFLVTGAVPLAEVTDRRPRLDVAVEGELRDLALIDVATSRQLWVGARAIWDPSHISEVVLSRIDPAAIGLCALGGRLFPAMAGRDIGAYLHLGPGGRDVLAALAPGLIRSVPIATARTLAPGETVTLDGGPCTVALDGEREFEILRPEQRLTVTLNPHGPLVVDIPKALCLGAQQ